MNERIYNSLFGARIKYYREKQGFTQKELSEKIGYTTHATISRIEKGDQTIPLSKLPDFCAALNVHPYDLIGLREEDKRLWLIAEKMDKEGRTSDLSKFIDVYLKLMEGKNDGVGDLDR